MKKPNGYDQAETMKEFETIERGPHIMVIKKIEDATSKAGKPMIKIFLDTDKEDKQPNFFEKKWREDTRDTKTWGCISYIMCDGSEFANKMLKTFNEAVQASNGNFPIDWDNYNSQFVGKKVCGVFRIEQYISDSDGEVKSPVKLYSFRTIQAMKEGKIKDPKDKLIDKNTGSNNNFGLDDDITPIDDGDMPF